MRRAASDERKLRSHYLPPDRVYYELSRCYRRLGDEEKAAEMLRRAAGPNPDEPRYRQADER